MKVDVIVLLNIVASLVATMIWIVALWLSWDNLRTVTRLTDDQVHNHARPRSNIHATTSKAPPR